MFEIKEWKSNRRCHPCLEKGDTNYLIAQKWGKTDEGQQLYKLDCIECGHHDNLTTWDGK